MGEALLAVVVADPAAARRALDSLRSSKTAGAVIALDAVLSDDGDVALSFGASSALVEQLRAGARADVLATALN